MSDDRTHIRRDKPAETVEFPATSTLAQFLLARIAEDEAVAGDGERWATSHSKYVAGVYVHCDRPNGPQVRHATTTAKRDAEHIARHDPARVLAECEAKRERVELLTSWAALCSPDDWPEGDMSGAALSDAGRRLLRIEALPYADHPDCREEWKL